MMQKEPLLSVIVPIYNSEKYLSKCIDSIIKQTYKNLEIILVDDGSTDLSEQIGNQYANQDTRVKLIHKENGGVSSARNAGLDIATGDFIGFVDSDDWIDPSMYEKLINLVLKYNTAIAACGYLMENGTKNKKDEVITGTFNKNEALRNILMPQGFEGFLCNKIFSYGLLNGSENKLRLNEDIYFCEDQLYLCQVIIRTDAVAFSTEQLYHYFIHPHAATCKFTKKSLSELEAKKIIIDILEPYNEQTAKASYSNSASFLLCKLYQSKVKDRETARLLQKESKRYIKEFQSANYPTKEIIRMKGVLLYPPIFCRFWNFIKTKNLVLSGKAGSCKLNLHIAKNLRST